MPLYEYQCDACGKRFESIQRFADPPLEVCKLCGQGPVRRLQSSPAIQFKGSGWYVTDYARKSSESGSGKGEGGDAKPKGESSSTTSDAKPASDGGAKGGDAPSTSKSDAPSKPSS